MGRRFQTYPPSWPERFLFCFVCFCFRFRSSLAPGTHPPGVKPSCFVFVSKQQLFRTEALAGPTYPPCYAPVTPWNKTQPDDEGVIHPLVSFNKFQFCFKYIIVIVKPTCPASHRFWKVFCFVCLSCFVSSFQTTARRRTHLATLYWTLRSKHFVLLCFIGFAAGSPKPPSHLALMPEVKIKQ